MTSHLPIGAVLAYAGAGTPPGWLACDGSSFAISAYPGLWNMLQGANGAGPNSFNLPNYQGIFIRGRDRGLGRDPDAATRPAAASGGSSGDAAGSVQTAATSNTRDAAKRFRATFPHLPQGSHKAYTTSGVDLADWNGDSVTVDFTSGGDAETRPVNANVNFIIKATPTAELPVGAVISYAGERFAPSPDRDAYWLICDGTLYSQSKYAALFAAIGAASGGSTSSFNLPDLRGRFLRGVANGNSRAPGAAQRTPAAAGGNPGDAVGSVQDWATGPPVEPFKVDATHLPIAHHSVLELSGYERSMWDGGSTSIDIASGGGGELESRGVNAAVDFYILHDVPTDTLDPFPIGGLIALPTDIAPPSMWRLCDGSRVESSDPVYAALDRAISNVNGGSDQYLDLPDYRARFQRGRDRGSGNDPEARLRPAAQPGGDHGDAVGSVQDWATARPRDALTGTAAHLPTSGKQTGTLGAGDEYAQWQDQSTTFDVRGGDRETRPYNAYVNWYIKVAESPP